MRSESSTGYAWENQLVNSDTNKTAATVVKVTEPLLYGWTISLTPQSKHNL